MGTMLSRIEDEETLADRREDLIARAKALVAMGLVSREADGTYDVMVPGWARGSHKVSTHMLYCSCGDGPVCVHCEAVRLFVKQPEKKPTPARREADPVGPNVAKTNRYTARNMRTLITPKQCVAIRIVAQTMGIDPRTLSNERYGCDYEKLSIYWAGKFYESLRQMRDGQRKEKYGW